MKNEATLTPPKETSPAPPRQRRGFQFPLPTKDIDNYMAGRAGKYMVRVKVEVAVQEYLIGRAHDALADLAGGDQNPVAALMAKVLAG